MNNLFVSKEIAWQLKNKGFFEPCIKAIKDNEEFTACGFNLTNHGNTHEYTIPMFQQVVDWLREKHNIWLEMYFGSRSTSGYEYWNCKIYTSQSGVYSHINKIDSKDGYSDNFKNYTYYQTLSLSIEEALKLI